MKIIGILTGWGCQDWINKAILQGLKYCDELHVCISAHSDSLLKFEDNSYKIAKEYGKVINLFEYNKRSFHALVKSEILNTALLNSKYYEKGNWVWVLDVDEFYTEKVFETIKEALPSDMVDIISFMSRFFYINTKNYIISEHYRLFKIQDKNCRFFPTQNWPYGKNLLRLPIELGMFHYSMMMNPHMKREFWNAEYKYKQDHKVQWLDNIYKNYDLNNEEYWLQKNKELTGNYGPWISDAFKPQKDGTLFKYDKEHPSLIQNSKLVEIEDYRDWWGFK